MPLQECKLPQVPLVKRNKATSHTIAIINTSDATPKNTLTSSPGSIQRSLDNTVCAPDIARAALPTTPLVNIAFHSMGKPVGI